MVFVAVVFVGTNSSDHHEEEPSQEVVDDEEEDDEPVPSCPSSTYNVLVCSI